MNARSMEMICEDMVALDGMGFYDGAGDQASLSLRYNDFVFSFLTKGEVKSLADELNNVIQPVLASRIGLLKTELKEALRQ